MFFGDKFTKFPKENSTIPSITENHVLSMSHPMTGYNHVERSPMLSN